MTKTSPTLFGRAAQYGDRLAIVDPSGEYRYSDLLQTAERIARLLLSNRSSLDGARVAYQIPPSFAWVAITWGVWRAGGMAVPLALSQPAPELDYLLEDCGAEIVIAAEAFVDSLQPVAEKRALRFLSEKTLVPSAASSEKSLAPLPEVDAERGALMVYTSGTTGRPKGVEIKHRHLQAQMECLTDAWGWTSKDRILEVLPLHHVHGVVNVVSCALWSGAVCEMLPRFDAHQVWTALASGRLSLFMAVPTIYVRLIRTFDEAPDEQQQRWAAGARRLRLMVSGSAALPVPVLERWEKITGHRLLERYGMTEIGMALSNPLDGQRLAGSVGRPLPGVNVRLVDEAGETVGDGVPGEIEVRGSTVFDRYWQRPEATRQAFRDGWFQTGDLAVRDEAGVYRILGRQSVDILKSGGEKVSALEIEAILREHPAIRDCAVVGVPDPEWGQRICVAAVLDEDESLDIDTLRSWAKERLAIYKVPSRLMPLEDLPRNALGKVTKPKVIELFEAE